jgi:hypothetical protein
MLKQTWRIGARQNARQRKFLLTIKGTPIAATRTRMQGGRTMCSKGAARSLKFRFPARRPYPAFPIPKSQGQKSTVNMANFGQAARQFEGARFAVDKASAV